jgi:hypothetical protein
MTALVFIIERRDFHPPPEDCRHSGVDIYDDYIKVESYDGYEIITTPDPPLPPF